MASNCAVMGHDSCPQNSEEIWLGTNAYGILRMWGGKQKTFAGFARLDPKGNARTLKLDPQQIGFQRFMMKPGVGQQKHFPLKTFAPF